MKNLLLIILLSPLIVYSQISLKGTIVDSQKNLIQFASISINQTANGTYTNEKGIFHFDSIQPTDTLQISCIGFESRSIAVNSLSDTILLQEISIEIGEVVIKSEYTRELIGCLKNKDRGKDGGLNGGIAGIQINNISSSYLESIEFYIKKSKELAPNLFFLHLYKLEADNKQSPILSQRISIPTNEKGWVKIDLSKQFIKVKDSIFIAYETVPNPKYFKDVKEVPIVNMSEYDAATIGYAKIKDKANSRNRSGRDGIGWFTWPDEWISEYGNWVPMIRATVRY
jgi:hypothetical protein